MLKSDKLYPRRIKRERLFITEQVKERLIGLPEVIMHTEGIRKALKWDYATYDAFINAKRVPSLEEYLNICDYLGYNLKRDVNYYYANVILTPKEIKRRVMRCFYFIETFSDSCLYIGQELGYTLTAVTNTVNYRMGRSMQMYGHLLKYIQASEKKGGYEDALTLED